VYGGSADVMVRSFDRRIESMFAFVNPRVKQQAIHILDYNLRDNVNSYELLEDGNYIKCAIPEEGETFNIHERFFEVTLEEVMKTQLFFQPRPQEESSAESPLTEIESEA
jgi:polyphosphate kinase